jgi:hypothetical protein
MGFRRLRWRSLPGRSQSRLKGFATSRGQVVQLVLRPLPNADRPNCARTPGSAVGRSPHRREESPNACAIVRPGLSALVEERVDGGFDGRGQGCGYVRRGQLPADRQRALQRLAGVAAAMALREMCLHRRAHARIDLPFEMLREERQDIRAQFSAGWRDWRPSQRRRELFTDGDSRPMQSALDGLGSARCWATPGAGASSDSSRVGANLLRRRFLMQNRRAMV